MVQSSHGGAIPCDAKFSRLLSQQVFQEGVASPERVKTRGPIVTGALEPAGGAGGAGANRRVGSSRHANHATRQRTKAPAKLRPLQLAKALLLTTMTTVPHSTLAKSGNTPLLPTVDFPRAGAPLGILGLIVLNHIRRTLPPSRCRYPKNWCTSSKCPLAYVKLSKWLVQSVVANVKHYE